MILENGKKNFSVYAKAKGFTLLEMLISTGIFAVIIITAVGAMLAMNQAQIKAVNVQNIQDNLRFLLESMTKELRTGSGYTVSLCGPQGCSAITFTRQDGIAAGYCLDGTAVKRFLPPAICTAGSPVTSSAVSVSKLYFNVIGNAPGPSDGQPRVTVVLEARSISPELTLETAFNLQTTVTARLRDL